MLPPCAPHLGTQGLQLGLSNPPHLPPHTQGTLQGTVPLPVISQGRATSSQDNPAVAAGEGA